jgi:peptidoglycan/xylan/chitin deacetylase (PgdA/CDA1 family)
MVVGQRVKQHLKSAVYLGVGAAVHLSGLGAVRRWFGSAGTLRVLTYHKLSRLADNPPSVPPSLFAAQMELLRARFHPIAIEDLLAARRGERPLPERAVLVTFDDGYRDALLEAGPILRRLGIPAVMFLATDFLGGVRPLPHDAARAAAGIKSPTLTWREAAQLGEYGFAIGSHGASHRRLTSLDPEALRDEVVRSKAVLEQRLGVAVRCFAYAKGSRDSFDDAVVEAVRAAGYELGFSTVPGAVRAEDHPLTLRRYSVEPLPPYAFARLLAGDCDLVAIKDSRTGGVGRRWLNRLLGTETP